MPPVDIGKVNQAHVKLHGVSIESVSLLRRSKHTV